MLDFLRNIPGVSNLMESAADEVPEARKLNLSPEAQQFMSDNANRALTSTQDMRSQLNNAVSSSANTFAPIDMQLSGALTNKYRAGLSNKLGAVRDANLTTPYKYGGQALAQSVDALNAKQKIQTSNYERQLTAYNAKEEARAQVLGAVLGLGAQVGVSAMSKNGNQGSSNNQTSSASYLNDNQNAASNNNNSGSPYAGSYQYNANLGRA